MTLFALRTLTCISAHSDERKKQTSLRFSRSDRKNGVHQPEKDQDANWKTHARRHASIARCRGVRELKAFLFIEELNEMGGVGRVDVTGPWNPNLSLLAPRTNQPL